MWFPSEEISYEELFLYGLVSKKYNSLDLYNQLSFNNSTKITIDNLKLYLLNVNEQIYIYSKILENKSEITNESKQYITYEDLYNLDIDKLNILIPIGQTIISKFSK